MVDALCRARHWLTPGGCVIDLRPAEVVPEVEIGLRGGTVRIGGLVVDPERRARHRAADQAVREVVSRGVFSLDAEAEFPFYYYAGSADELRDYVAAKWRHSRLGHPAYLRAVELLGANPDGRLWLRERVAIRRLIPVAGAV